MQPEGTESLQLEWAALQVARAKRTKSRPPGAMCGSRMEERQLQRAVTVATRTLARQPERSSAVTLPPDRCSHFHQGCRCKLRRHYSRWQCRTALPCLALTNVGAAMRPCVTLLQWPLSQRVRWHWHCQWTLCFKLPVAAAAQPHCVEDHPAPPTMRTGTWHLAPLSIPVDARLHVGNGCQCILDSAGSFSRKVATERIALSESRSPGRRATYEHAD